MKTPRPRKMVRSRGFSRRQVLGGALAVAAGCRSELVADADSAMQALDSGPAGDSHPGWPVDSSSNTVETGETGETGDTGEPLETFDISAYQEDEAVWPTAVIAGVVEQTAVRLACVVADAGDVRLVVWGDSLVLVWDAVATPSEAGALQVDVDGLEPGRWYGYAFVRDASMTRSVVGRVHTAPEDGSLEPLRLALSACNGSSNDPWPVMSVMADEEPHLLLHLGDMAYNDGRSTAEAFRENWRWYLSGDGYRDAFARCGLLATWDDHEVTNDWDPDSVDAEVVATALEAYFEHLPVWRGDDGRIWRSYRWGLTAEIFVLDCRSERVPDSRQSDDAEYISVEQMEWLKTALADSPCVFKIVMNSVPITDMPGLFDLAASDRWEGYAAQRQELLFELSAKGIEDVFFVSGDFHVCFAGLIQPDMGGAAGRTWEIACTSGNQNILGEWLTDWEPDQFAFSTSSPRGVVLDLDPMTRECTVRFLNENGDLDQELVLLQD